MALVTHLHSSGGGMAARTACGRNILRTPLSTSWEGFKTETNRCEKCEQSKLFSFLTRKDQDQWVPVADQDAWKAADDALMAASRKNMGGPYRLSMKDNRIFTAYKVSVCGNQVRRCYKHGLSLIDVQALPLGRQKDAVGFFVWQYCADDRACSRS